MMLWNWDSIRQAGPEQVGGKAWNLARLAHFGFAVPEGIALTTRAYQQWIEASGLGAALTAAARQSDKLEALRDKLLTIPTGLDLAALPAGALAIRSSAPQEDSAHASFAGIHTSCLNVQGTAAIEQAIRSVWLSLWTPAAVAYREHMGLAHEAAAMAVLIMPQISAKVSGIAFTCDPLSGRDDRLIIHAIDGLGESLVSGKTSGDEIVLAEDLLDDRLSVLQINPGEKRLRVDPKPGGGTQTLHRSGNTPPVLTQSEALRLGEQLRLAAIALDYSHPMFDLEWVFDGEQFWLLQARPVTAMQRCTYPALQSQPDIWSRGNTRDVVPDPLSPIDWSASRRLVNTILQQGVALAGLKLHPGAQRAGLFHGRLCLNLSLLQWEGYATIGILPAAMNRLIGGHQPEIRVPPPTLQQQLGRKLNLLRYVFKSPARRKAGRRLVDEVMTQTARWRQQPLPQSESDFAAALRLNSRYSRGVYDIHFLQGSASGGLNFLVDMIDTYLPGEGHALAAALMAGEPLSVTAQQSYELIALARQAAADALVRAWLQKKRAGDARHWIDLPKDNPFRIAFAEFLERYGHRGLYETYTRNPRWREQPDYLLDSLLDLAETDLDSLLAKRNQAASSACKRVKQALPWWLRPLLGALIRDAKAGSNEREAARSANIAVLEISRRILLALGERWVESGWLSRADDIFYLLRPEIYAVLDGALSASALSVRIEQRRRQFENQLTEAAPDVILKHTDGSLQEQDIEAPIHSTSRDDLLGIPVGAGRASGLARLLTTPYQGEKLQRGDILVVPSTDPAWTPLFLKAGGLVMETGGYLSHGAIVAREFGIPAVVNLPGIMQQLEDGQILEVDGDRGIVRRLTQ